MRKGLKGWLKRLDKFPGLISLVLVKSIYKVGGLESERAVNKVYSYSMRLKKLELKNYRGFSGLHLDFPAQGSAVFIGWNGAGKSSVLEAIKGIMFLLSRRILSESELPKDTLGDLDVKVGEQSCVLSAEFVRPDENKTIELKISHDLASGSASYKLDPHSGAWLVKEEDKGQLLSNHSIPVLAYYTVDRRLIMQAAEQQESKRYLIPQQRAYEGAWGGSLQFDHFIRWFVEEENKENREKIRLKDFEYKHPALNAVRKAWQSFFAAIGESQYENLRVEERAFNQFTSAPSSLVITKDGQDLNLQQLSDGERLSLGMVADIAHRLVLANPALDDPLQGHGIVLIDEIELHLHPAWQRRIVPALEQTFPNIQFIMTTHSPQVLSRLPREHVFILDRFKVVAKTPYTEGRDSNSILYDLFGLEARPELEEKELSELYKYIDAEKLEKARGLLEKLKEKLGEGDAEIQRAEMHLSLLTE